VQEIQPQKVNYPLLKKDPFEKLRKRQALKKLAQAPNLTMSENAFGDRQQGNTLPRKWLPDNFF
jgi:hypothetical protein